MHLSVLVIGQRILLKSADDKFIRDFHLIAIGRIHHEFKYVEQLAGITSAIAKDGSCFLQRNLPFFQKNILGNGTVEQLQEVVLFQ